MASILHRGPHQYRVQIRSKGVNLCQTFETLKAAQDWARETEGRIKGGEQVQRRPTISVAEACEWMKGQIGKNPHSKNERTFLHYWATSKFAHWSLAAVKEWDIIEWRREVLDEDNADETGIGPAALFGAQSCIHRMNTFSKIVQTWGRANKVTLDNPIRPGVRPSKPEGRKRRVYPEEEVLVLEAASRSTRPWLRAAIIISIETALRQAELVGLEWNRVNLDRRFVDLSKTKNDRQRRVPLSERAVAAFQSLLRSGPKVLPVETTAGVIGAFRDINTFDDLHWHDFRHEAVSRLFEYTDLRDNEIMAISGHLSPSMLTRYTHLRTDRLADRLPGGKLNAGLVA